jgi:hypothetical protein
MTAMLILARRAASVSRSAVEQPTNLSEIQRCRSAPALRVTDPRSKIRTAGKMNKRLQKRVLTWVVRRASPNSAGETMSNKVCGRRSRTSINL